MSRPPTGAAAGSQDSWHSCAVEDVLQRLDSTAEGLTSSDAEARLGQYGLNRLAPPARSSALRVLLAQFKSLVVLLLLAAGTVAWMLGDLLEASAIGAVLAINTLIGFAVELRARRAMEALLSYEVPEARVLRDGELRAISADRLVPGDVVELVEGDNVPADARVLAAAELQLNEAALTGESFPVGKSELPVPDPMTVLADRTSMLYAATSVYVGRARAVVVGTGSDTQIGRIGTLLATVEAGKTPLETRLDRLGARLVWLTLGVAGAVTLLGVLRGAPFARMLETGIALAIAAAPEGLPAVATIALAVGLKRMARRNALVRRLAAVEALGATTVVCTDKTGTLTSGEMVATRIASGDRVIDVTDEGPSDGLSDPDGESWLGRLLEAAALTSRASRDPATGAMVGDPTDAALTILADKSGIDAPALLDATPRVDEVPFSSERRWSASMHSNGGPNRIFVKGAPGTVLDMCARVAGDGPDRSLDSPARERLQGLNTEFAAHGLRVIALASGHHDEAQGHTPRDLTFLGLVGIMDPPAAGVSGTLEELRAASIRTVMITGDQQATGETIARNLGILEDGYSALGGRELADLSDAQLTERVGSVAVFSRVSPEDKLRIVAALQRRGEIVAMIGDGVNDAAALKKADIGVAMGGRGTDIAKDTAGIVLRDDQFHTIGAAVEEGRVIFENIRKFVFYLFSCNVAEVLVLLTSSLAGLPLPLTALQILWLNLVTDTFPALALAMEPAEPDVMKRPPRVPDAAILSRRFLLAMGFYAGLITIVTLAGYVYGLETGEDGRAMTIAFMTLALAQLFHLGNARGRTPVIAPRRAFANRWALGAVPLVLALQVLAIYWPPLASTLHTVPLRPSDWAIIFGLSVVPAVIGQLVEWAGARRLAQVVGA
jgi:Ca2+-transporting ATPase